MPPLCALLMVHFIPCGFLLLLLALIFLVCLLRGTLLLIVSYAAAGEKEYHDASLVHIVGSKLGTMICYFGDLLM